MVAMESLIGEEEDSSCHTTVTTQRHLNVLSDRWIAPEFLQEFLEAIFLIETMESLLCEANVRLCQTRVTP